MDEIREIVSITALDRLFLSLALGVPCVCALLGAVWGARTGKRVAAARLGAFFGLLALLNYALWKVYNLITDRLGLDTVKNLFVNLFLFLLLGFGIGYAIGAWRRKHDANA